ncbi:MAG: diguanylate cyclase [Actinomycetota bacterium]
MHGEPAPGPFLTALPDAAVLLLTDGTIQWGNDAATELSGLRLDEADGTNVLDLLHPDDHATVFNAFTSVQEHDGDAGGLIDVRIRHTSGAWRPVELRGRMVGDQVLVILRATIDRQQLELGQGGHERLRALVHHAHAILVSLDRDGRIRSSNTHLTRVLGHDDPDVNGLPFDELLAPDDRVAFREALRSPDGAARLDARAPHVDGHIVHLDIHLTDLREDEIQDGYTLSAADITDLKTTQKALRHMADHDALTGLLNRRALLARLDDFVGDGFQHEIVILFCDLDGFKTINDRIGHAAGDQALVEVARRIERCVRPGDLVGRLGGDEFVVVLPRMDADDTDRMRISIRTALRAPMLVADEVVEVDVSIGSATTGDSPTAARLLATADDAMYAVKRRRSSH